MRCGGACLVVVGCCPTSQSMRSKSIANRCFVLVLLAAGQTSVESHRPSTIPVLVVVVFGWWASFGDRDGDGDGDLGLRGRVSCEVIR